MKQILYGLLLGAMAVDQVLGCAAKYDLARDADGCIFLEADGRLFLVAIVKDNCNASFCDACLAALVDEILYDSQLCSSYSLISRYLAPRSQTALSTYLEILRTNGRHVGDTQNKANGIQNVGFAAAIQARD